MTFPSEVCSTCLSVLNPEAGFIQQSKPDSLGWVTPHGQTFDTFRYAVLKNCIICSTIWSHSEHDRLSSSAVSAYVWKPLQYRAEGMRNGEKGILRLYVMYQDQQKKMYTDLRFRLIAAENYEYSSCFKPANAEDSTSSEATLKMAHQWFSSCHSMHTKCSQLASFSSGILPTRLIDIGQESDTHWILRIVSEDNVPSQSAYITLSYRWGHSPTLLLLSSNIDQFRRGSPVNILPRTFRDVITVAKHFGMRYIWIDALCIIQDSLKDWETEAPAMRHVYANSACNIAASASHNPEEGLFRTRSPESLQPVTVLSSLFAKRPSPHYIFEKGYWDRQIQGPLHGRGWVFQERLLAPRLLYFGKDQVLWECLAEHKCESFPQGIPGHWSDKNLDPLLHLLSKTKAESNAHMDALVFNLWNDLVKQYSHCSLTKPSDKLFAMAGIARLFGDATGDEYVAGWWRSHLLESLDWRVFEPQPQQGVQYRAPSWSWASTDSPVRTAGISPSMQFLVELLDIQATAGAMVNTCEATLTLRGAAFSGVCLRGANGEQFLQTERGEIATWLYPDSLDTDLTAGKRIVCIPYKMYYVYGSDDERSPLVVCFIMDEVGQSNRRPILRRLGFFWLKKDQIQKFGTGWKSLEMILI